MSVMEEKLKKLLNKLKKDEIIHLMVDANVHSLTGLERNFKGMVKDRKRQETEPCWDCKAIAIKLGYPV